MRTPILPLPGLTGAAYSAALCCATWIDLRMLRMKACARSSPPSSPPELSGTFVGFRVRTVLIPLKSRRCARRQGVVSYVTCLDPLLLGVRERRRFQPRDLHVQSL